MIVKIRNIPFYMMCFYLIIECAFGYTTLQQIFLVLFVLSSVCVNMFIDKNYKIGIFGIGYLLFTIWSGIQIVLGICFNEQVSQTMFITLLLNMLFIISIYQTNCNVDDLERNLKGLVSSFFVALSIIIVGSGNQLLSGRLALRNDSGISFTIGPLISRISPNGIALWCTLGFIICMYLKKQYPKRIYTFLQVCFILGVILSASRKGIIVLIIGFGVFYVMSASNRNKAIRIGVFLFIIVALVISIFNIPALYNLVGYRIEEMMNLLVTKSSNEAVIGGSLRTRVYLIEMANQYISDRFWTGYGLNSFQAMVPIHIVADNNYLEIMVAGGVVGLLIYYFPAVKMLKDIIRYGRSQKNLFLYLVISIFVIAILADFSSSSYYLRETLLPFALLSAWISCIQDGVGRIANEN